MDPDIPMPSVEHDGTHVAPRTNNFKAFRDTTDSPLASSSANGTPFKTPASHPATPAPLKTPRSPSLGLKERRSTPTLQLQRSSSSLSVSRGQTPSGTQLRRVSSNLNPDSPKTNTRPPELIMPPQMTAESVAKEYFRRELEAHANAESKTIVIVHDSCYGHRFSRPRTSKAALSTIVERPERIHATMLGASTAYVRLGERHVEGAYGPHPDRDVAALPDPPFLLKKTTRSIPLDRAAVTHVHGTKWMEELQIMCDSAESKLALNGKELQRPIGYGKDENGNTLPKLHEGDLYLCSESLAALQGCLGGVCDAVDTVFSPNITQRAFVCIRPPGHHCSSNFPSGFCWLNNVHVGISYAAINHGLTHAAIIDFDLHHGDGSQTVTWNHNQKAQSLPKNAAQHKRTPIGYYSLHDINSYPCEWGDEDKVRNASLCIDNAHGQSIWNVHLEPWTSLDHFWQLYETKYRVLLDKTKSFLQHHSDKLRSTGVQPKAAIFISAGFDASQWEGQGMQRHNVNVPTEFYARFTSDIVKLSSEANLGVDGRVISVLEGGYSDRALASGVLSHICGLSGDRTGTSSVGLGVDLSSSVNAAMSHSPYEPQWWHEDNLQALENRVAGIRPPSPPKRKDKAPGSYSSPTHASTARMTDVARERKSLSSSLEARLLLDNADPEPPHPVDWIEAAYGLSRVLIPDDRQTLSCRHDELNAEATKARRDRQSAIGVMVPTEPRMQLRTRGKASGVESEAVRASSRTSNRRTTIAAVSELPDPSMAAQRPRRRSSAASGILSSFQDMKLEDGTASSIEHSNSAVENTERPGSSRGLDNKKSRMPPPARKTAARISTPRKAKEAAPSASKVSSLQDKLNDARSQRNTPPPQAEPRPSVNGSGDSAGRDDMDDLTSGMKKVSIKLKMPTPEQHAENQRKAESAKVQKPRVIRKPPVSKAARVKATPALVSANVPQSPPVSSKDAVLAAEPVQSRSVITEPFSSEANQTSDLTGAAQIDAAGAAYHPGYQAPTVSTSSSVDASLRSTISDTRSGPNGVNLSPRVTTDPVAEDAEPAMPVSKAVEQPRSTASARTKADLPVFTSSSPISFAKASNTNHENEYTASTWEVPVTPKS